MAGMLFTHSAGICFVLTFSTSFHFKRIDQKTGRKTTKTDVKEESISLAAGLLAKYVCTFKVVNLVVSLPAGSYSTEINTKLHTTAGT